MKAFSNQICIHVSLKWISHSIWKAVYDMPTNNFDFKYLFGGNTLKENICTLHQSASVFLETKTFYRQMTSRSFQSYAHANWKSLKMKQTINISFFIKQQCIFTSSNLVITLLCWYILSRHQGPNSEMLATDWSDCHCYSIDSELHHVPKSNKNVTVYTGKNLLNNHQKLVNSRLGRTFFKLLFKGPDKHFFVSWVNH